MQHKLLNGVSIYLAHTIHFLQDMYLQRTLT